MALKQEGTDPVSINLDSFHHYDFSDCKSLALLACYLQAGSNSRSSTNNPAPKVQWTEMSIYLQHIRFVKTLSDDESLLANVCSQY